MPVLLLSIFWLVLAAGFLGLAVVATRERKRVTEKATDLWDIPGVGPEIEKTVADALKTILLVELIGFVLASAAAVLSLFGS